MARSARWDIRLGSRDARSGQSSRIYFLWDGSCCHRQITVLPTVQPNWAAAVTPTRVLATGGEAECPSSGSHTREGGPYAGCREPLHTDRTQTITAEPRLRSRYSAFALQLDDPLAHLAPRTSPSTTRGGPDFGPSTSSTAPRTTNTGPSSASPASATADAPPPCANDPGSSTVADVGCARTASREGTQFRSPWNSSSLGPRTPWAYPDFVDT